MSSAKWLTPNLTSPLPLAETINNVLDPVISVITSLLNITSAILDILAFLNSLSADPLLAAMTALFNVISDVLDSLINFAFSVFLYTPEYWDEESARGYAQFIETLEASLDDPGDLARPRLKLTTPFFALAIGTGSLAPLDLMNFLKKFADLVTEKFVKIKNAIFTFIPQAPGLGVVSGLEASSKGDSISINPGKFLQKEREISEIYVQTDVYDFEASRAYVLVAFTSTPDVEPPLLPVDVTYVVSVPIGDVVVLNPGTPQEDRTVNRDLGLLAELGFSTIFLAYFETNSTGTIDYFNANYRKVLADMSEEELKDQVKKEQIKAIDPNWHGWSLRSIQWFEPVLTTINEARRKGQPQASLNDSLTQLKDLTHTIAQDFQDVSQGLKDVTTGIQTVLDVIVGASLLFVTPFPSILSGKDPYKLNSDDSFTLEMDATSQAAGSPTGVKTITFTGTQGAYTGIDNINFNIPSGSKFWMDTYLRRSRLLFGGTVDDTLGLTGGIENPKGVFTGGSDSRVFRIPNSGADLKINTFGKGIEILSETNDLNTLLSLPVSSDTDSIESTGSTFKYHYPTGASFKLSLWAKDTAVYNTPNSALPTLGLAGSVYDTGLNEIRGIDARKFNIPNNTGCYISLYTNNRDYLSSPLRTKIGFDSHTSDVTGNIDTGNDARKVYIPGIGGYRVTFTIRSASLVSSPVLDSLLGFDSIVTEHGGFTGSDASQLTYPTSTFNYNTYVNKASNMAGEIFDLTGFSSFPSAKGNILSIDRRLFSWDVTHGFNITVKNNALTIFSGQISIIAAGVNKSGTSLANQVTYALRQLPGARGIETCTFESTGLFRFYFGNDVTDVIFSPHANPGKDILNSLGLTPGTYNPVGNFINGSEPLIFKVSGLGDFSIKLGKNTYSNFIPQGLYTGSNLAALLESALQLATGKSENITYNLGNGRFNLTLDTGGYLSSDNQSISLNASVKKSIQDVVTEINSQLIKDDYTEAFVSNNGSISYSQDGLLSIEFISGGLLDVLGFTLGLNTASLYVFYGGTVKNFYFEPGDNNLQLLINKNPIVVSLPTNTSLSFQDIQNYINTNYPAILCSIVSNSKFKIYSNSTLDLINNYLFFYPSSSTQSINDELLDLKSRFDSALGDGFVSLSFDQDKFSISYPDLEILTFTSPGIGSDYRTKFGFQDASGLIGSYTGQEANLLEIDPGDYLGIKLGSYVYNATVPLGETSYTSLAASLTSNLSTLTTVYPTLEYDLATGYFAFNHDNSGYLQIDNKLLTLPTSSNQIGTNIASTLQTNIRSLAGSNGTENCIFIADKFLITSPGLKKIVFTSSPGYLSLPLVIGLGFGSYTAVSGRVEGLEPSYFFIQSSNNNFDYGLSPTISNVLIPDSTDFESGTNLASRIKVVLNTATGGDENVLFNTDDGYFSIVPSPDGFQILNNEEIYIPPEAGYIDPEDLLVDLNMALSTALIGLSAEYDNSIYTLNYAGMAKIEITPGLNGLSLEDLLGFTLGLKSNLNSKISSDSSLKYLSFHADANTLKIRLGGTIHNVIFPISGLLYTPSTFRDTLESAIRSLSGRSTIVSYDAISHHFLIGIDPTGEKLVIDFNPSFSGLLTLDDVATELNTIASTPGATAGEVFTPDTDQLLFEDLTGLTLNIETSPGSLFDLRQAIGLDINKQVTGQVTFNKIKNYIITLGENDIFNFDLNTVLNTVLIPPGVYNSTGIISQVEGLLAPNIEEMVFDSNTGVFTISSDPEGKLHSSFNIQLPAVTGPMTNLLSDLEATVHSLSTEDDELFSSLGSQIKEFKTDLRAVVFRQDNTSSFADILKVLGFQADHRYETDTEEVTFDEVSPFNSTATQNSFKVKYDNTLDITEVVIPEVSALSGSEMAAHIQKSLRSYLTAYIVRDMLYATANPLTSPVILPPFLDLPTLANSYVSDHFIKQIEKSVVDILFSNFNSLLYQQLQLSFPTDLNIPYLTSALNELTGIINSTVPASLLKIGDKLIKDSVRNLIRATLAEIYINVPGTIDPDNFITTLTPIINTAIDDAATALSFPITTDVKNEVSNTIATQFETVFANKYFYNTEVTYDPGLASFTVKSPAKGNLSRVEILPGDTNDITNHLGLDVGSETVGTGNIGLIHCATAQEVSDLFSAEGFQSFPFGTTSFRKERQSFGSTLTADYRYPHRYYTSTELPWSSEVYLMVRSFNITPSGYLRITNTVGSPTSILGLPTGDITAQLGRSGFTGAFRDAGSFNPKVASKGFVFVAILCIALPDTDPGFQFLKSNYNSIATLIGLQKWE